MAKAFRSPDELAKHLDTACEAAVQNACNRLLKTLKQYLGPEHTARADTSYRLAMAEKLTKTCGQILLHSETENHTFGAISPVSHSFSPVGAADGEYSDAERGWKEFEEYCRKNAVAVLKEELRKQGIHLS